MQEHMPLANIEGRMIPVDASGAHYALRVTLNNVLMALVVSAPASLQLVHDSSQSALRKLGGPSLCEATLGPADRALMERHAGDLNALLDVGRNDLVAWLQLKAITDVPVSHIKFLLNYALARAAKAAQRGTGGEGAAAGQLATARREYLDASHAMLALAPANPLASFMVAEAMIGTEGYTRNTLQAMREAVKACAAQGDDMMEWMAVLHVGQMLISGGGGATTCSEEEVRQVLARAKALKAGLRSWDGHLMLLDRCTMMKAAIKKRLAGPQPARGRVSVLTGGQQPGGGADFVRPPDQVQARECDGCHNKFHRTLTCAACKCAHYCCKECQAAAWPGHKKECKAKRAEQQQPQPQQGKAQAGATRGKHK